MRAESDPHGSDQVGCPAPIVGLQAEDPTIAAPSRNTGYARVSSGRITLATGTSILPTSHGFDEFFSNLDHLNAEEEPELDDYPTPQDFPKLSGAIRSTRRYHFWPTEDGTQRIQDTGPLTKKRMETVDEEFRDAAFDFMSRQAESERPFFLWFNSTHMHFRTHVKPASKGRSGRWQSDYHDTMLDHDDLVGEILDKVDELGLANDTIVLYSTDNGPHMNSWPDSGMTPFRGEKNTNWEGAYRVPAMVRWPGHIEPGQVKNDIMSHNDWFPTLLAAVASPTLPNSSRQEQS